MIALPLLKSSSLISLAVALGLAPNCSAQDDSGNKSWSQSSQQDNPGGTLNPTRTRETHTESDGRIVDKTSVETLGPDGRYIPYQDTEKESVRVDATLTRSIERVFGRGPDGQRTLIQERQEEARSLAGAEQKVVRTVSNPDADGKLHVVQHELQDSKQSAAGVRETKTTVLTPDADGNLTAAVQIEERQKQSSDGTVEFRKSTLLFDGAGHWQLSEVREGTSKEGSGQGRTQEERVLRPDANGKLAEVERTISKQTVGGTGEKRDTIETYSTNSSLFSARQPFAASPPEASRDQFVKSSAPARGIPPTICRSPKRPSTSSDRAEAAAPNRSARSSPRTPMAAWAKFGSTWARPPTLPQSR
jgi:hypothetical protein